ncbi:MAG: hypothetical protein JXA36_08370, partial [Coriobacteriia bacterium]|nr:hypothetical protein [Coriobacteriia bacterium]
ERPAEARRVLETAFQADMLASVQERAVALLALALLRHADGDAPAAISLLDRADNELVLTERAEEIVRWDILLARAGVLADSGAVAEAAACARTGLALFEDSDHTVAWHRPTLIELERLALADDDPCTPFLVPKALGALRLADRFAALQWLKLQESIIRELARRGSDDLAQDHAAKALCALPVDLFGAEKWWYEAMQFLGRVGAPGLLSNTLELAGAFELAEREFNEISDYEPSAPLLPRNRVIDR